MSKKHLILQAILITAMLLSSCQPPSRTKTPTQSMQDNYTISPTSTKATATQSFTSVPSPEIVSPVVTGDLYKTILSFPAGKTGFPYRGIDMPGMEITGPNAFAIFSDGRYVIADLIDNRLHIFSPAGEQLTIINLSPLGIMNVSDLQIYKDEIYGLEIYLNPPIHYRINILSPDGKRLKYFDIPDGYHIEDGLNGFMIDCNGIIFLDMAGKLRPLPVSNESLIAKNENHYECNGKSYDVLDINLGEKPKLTVGTFTLTTSLTYGLGSLSILKVLPDGSFFVVRSDVVNDQVIQVDDTVHYFSPEGKQLGVARVPVDERYYYVMRNLAVGPDSNVYCLLPKSDSIKIVRLIFYTSMKPLLPGVEPPTISSDATGISH